MNGLDCLLKEDWEERKFRDSFRRMDWLSFYVVATSGCSQSTT